MNEHKIKRLTLSSSEVSEAIESYPSEKGIDNVLNRYGKEHRGLIIEHGGKYVWHFNENGPGTATLYQLFEAKSE